jgi:hypothetical protein
MNETKLTARGIAYDLPSSPYLVKLDNVTLHFSSKFYLIGFKQRYLINRIRFNKSLTHRFGFLVIVNNIADVCLYSKIEKRGFCITTESGVQIWQPNEVVFNGGTVTKKD